ncbi:YagB/YeeU/YfjZ family protein [Xenorhabdus bovienii str. Jollieti]|uniref:Uncharacterized protein n=1 Tax=Xenorhabdus bovienii (strain SS-2004) TaxID=406818 RepID=D3V2J9_XENBS|nr:hypothetical protein XBJ1_1838 [Xenorhabdus bovienii SS-2004]CDH30654.1 YagB/YeeU/YfjZ family protein [Xenorhabdus bovienii str. Jollieti]
MILPPALAQGWYRRASVCITWLTGLVLRGSFSPIHLKKLDLAFPLFVEQLEDMLRAGELNPHQQRQVNIQLASLTCIADTRGSCGYVYISIYPTP